MPDKNHYFIIDCETRVMAWEFRNPIGRFPPFADFPWLEESNAGKW